MDSSPNSDLSSDLNSSSSSCIPDKYTKVLSPEPYKEYEMLLNKLLWTAENLSPGEVSKSEHFSGYVFNKNKIKYCSSAGGCLLYIEKNSLLKLDDDSFKKEAPEIVKKMKDLYRILEKKWEISIQKSLSEEENKKKRQIIEILKDF